MVMIFSYAGLQRMHRLKKQKATDDVKSIENWAENTDWAYPVYED